MEASETQCDVLVIGGGMAAAWAASAATETGARVILVDKGFVGTSGVTATAGPNHWWVPPNGNAREQAIEQRYAKGLGLADRTWMERVIETTWEHLPKLAAHYRFDIDDKGRTFHSGVRGPEYMRALRAHAIERGVTIRDHHPALELLTDSDGAVGGAAGYDRLRRRNWRITAGAVVMATGGCAFRSGLIGSHTNTGDGYLMAAEAGARLSGMEFSASYSISPAWCSTRTMPYTAARYYHAAGHELDVPGFLDGEGHLKALAAAMLEGPVFADLIDAPKILRSTLRYIQPATPPPFERKGIDLLSERFEVKLFGEGTIRGTGGLALIDRDCRTHVPGLYAVGDAATREPVAGATSGGGAQNSAWALTSGIVAGSAAADHARAARGRRPLRAIGRAGLRPSGTVRSVDACAITGRVQAEMLAYDKAIWRTAATLDTSSAVLDGLWREIEAHGAASGLDQVAARETAAMVATSRWCTEAARLRGETRGLHMRADFPATDPGGAHRIVLSGVDSITREHVGSNRDLAA